MLLICTLGASRSNVETVLEFKYTLKKCPRPVSFLELGTSEDFNDTYYIYYKLVWVYYKKYFNTYKERLGEHCEVIVAE